ncbi:excinuclease ABC subunit UvrC [Thermodesulfovibrio yellowstonii]|uniref:UvrABC system protein C n=1 Tax=Thermodesulfovibrio yellowstonii TaxID=28262 RepID=A0A9W6GF07_9BACT|nr:excinuclease ABC subunit UvrC [Thermodesulfovibrio islandicus]GLI52739.1 UvrABC system protein C [Thermodesulfovibrio islandicus]
MIELNTVPSLPGVYLFKDNKGKVLYVGKAKNLRNRLKSYFQSDDLDPRKSKMVKLIKDFSYIVTSNEFEALVLEANLIKQHKPSFNVLLRDDKSYPYLRITVVEEWPKIDVIRKPKKDGNLYFGPYVPAQSMWEALSFIRRNFPIRTCKYRLNKPIRPCVQYQMKRCPAPCAGFISREDYMKGVDEVVLFLKGQKTELLNILYEKMQKLSHELKFEAAAKIRDQIRRLEKIFAQQRVVSQTLDEMDVIGVYIEDSKISVNTLFVRNGLLVGSNDWTVKKAFYESEGELIHAVIEALYSKETLIPPPIIILENLPESLTEIKEWLKGKRGDFVELKTPSLEEEKALLDMALNNAKIHLQSKISPLETSLKELKQRLNLSEIPSKIGAFDVSTLFGSYSVGSFVYWQDGFFDKNLYRHLRIKEIQGIDDYSAMKEIVHRVVKKFNTELPEPDLILIDGGLGHLNAAIKVINELKEKFNVFAIAKDPDRLIFPDGRELVLEDKKPSSLLLKKIRNEAHRFAISYHKKLRKKAAFESLLEKIQGIGKKRRLTLLKHFGSISKIKAATVEEIASLQGFNLRLAGKVIEELNKIS